MHAAPPGVNAAGDTFPADEQPAPLLTASAEDPAVADEIAHWRSVCVLVAREVDEQCPVVGSVASRLRALAGRTAVRDLAALADEVVALEDRVLYLESTLHHICDVTGINERMLPDPLDLRLHAAPDAEGVP